MRPSRQPFRRLVACLFQVSILYNIVHLLFGVAGILMSRSFGAARAYLSGGGINLSGAFLAWTSGGSGVRPPTSYPSTRQMTSCIVRSANGRSLPRGGRRFPSTGRIPRSRTTQAPLPARPVVRTLTASSQVLMQEIGEELRPAERLAMLLCLIALNNHLGEELARP